MISLVDVFFAYAGLVTLSIFFFIIGFFINSIILSKIYFNIFSLYYHLLNGVLYTSSFYAIFCTKGFTILLPIPFLLAFLTSKISKNDKLFNDQVDKKKFFSLLIIILGSFVFYFVYYLQGYSTNAGNIHYIYGDQEFYTRVAQNISKNGIENMRVEYLYPNRFAVEPYHYGDIWFVALVIRLFPINPVVCSVLVVAPFLNTLFLFGLFSLINFLKINECSSKFRYILIFSGLVGGFTFLFPSFLFPHSVDIYSHSVANYTKLLWWSSILPLLLVFVYLGLEKYIVFIVFVIGLGYINVFPSLLLASFIWVLYYGKFKGDLKGYLKIYFFVGLIILCFLYWLYSYYPSTLNIKSSSAKANFNIKSLLKGWKTSINIFLGGGLQFLVYMPFLVLGAWKVNQFKKIDNGLKRLFLFLIFCAICSLIIWAVLFSVSFEAVQFFYNVFVVCIGALSVLVCYISLQTTSKLGYKILLLFLLLLSIYGNIKYEINVRSISKYELNEIKRIATNKKNPVFAHFRNEKDYTNDIFGSSTVIAMPLDIFSYFVKGYQNFSLNVSFSHLDSARSIYLLQKSNIDWAPMSYFIKLKENESLSKENVIYKFLYKNKVNYLCVPLDTELPAFLQKITKDETLLPNLAWKIFVIDEKRITEYFLKN